MNNVIDFVIVAGSAVAYAVLVSLAYVGGRHYSLGDAEAHSVEFSNDIKEGHGGVTALLWVTFAVVIAWTIFYLVDHASEFSVIGGG